MAPRPALFPETRQSAVALARSPDPDQRSRSRAVLAAAYYRPVYLHLRLRWRKPPVEAEDLTQAFFTAEAERDIFAAYDPTKARFRTYVRVCLDRLVANAERDRTRKKRGDGVTVVPIDHDVLEREIDRLPADQDVEAAFDQEWTRQLFVTSVEALRVTLEAEGRRDLFEIFARYDLHAADGPRPTYAEIAAERGIKATDVTNHLHAARREFRRAIVAALSEITATDDEFREELAALGIDAAKI